MKTVCNKNKVTQFKLLLNDIKDKVNFNSENEYSALYYKGRIEIIEFRNEFIKGRNNYRTRNFYFTKVKEDLYEDLEQSFREVFGNMPFVIMG